MEKRERDLHSTGSIPVPKPKLGVLGFALIVTQVVMLGQVL